MLHVQLKQDVDAGAIRYRLKSQLKRYWATDVWQTIFASLLEPLKPDAVLQYRHLLELLQQHLTAHPAAAIKLRAELVKQDSMF